MDLDRRVDEIGKLMEAIEGETGGVVWEQINAAELTAEARIEKFELNIANIIAKFEEVKGSRFIPDNNNQKKMTKKHIKYVDEFALNFWSAVLFKWDVSVLTKLLL